MNAVRAYERAKGVVVDRVSERVTEAPFVAPVPPLEIVAGPRLAPFLGPRRKLFGNVKCFKEEDFDFTLVMWMFDLAARGDEVRGA